MPVNKLWSSAVANIILALSPVRNAKQRFPRAEIHDYRHPDTLDSKKALEHLLGNLTDQQLDLMLLTDNIFFIGRIEYDNEASPQVTAFSFQAYASIGATLRQLKAGVGDAIVHYFRLEYHPKKPGRIFSEPTLHLHVNGNDAPRAPVELGPAGNPLLWFLEFLTLHYDYETWSAWSEDIAEDHHIETYTRMAEAFKLGTIHSDGATLYSDLQRLVQAMTHAKIQSTDPMTFSRPLSNLLNYRLG